MAVNSIKNRVLRRKADFENLKKTGRRLSPTSWLIVNYGKNEEQQLRFGLTVSAKVGSSVIRNKLKRWCRLYFRKAIDAGFDQGLDINVIFKTVSADFYKRISHKEVELALEEFFKRIQTYRNKR